MSFPAPPKVASPPIVTELAPKFNHIVPNPLENTMEIKCTVPENDPVEVKLHDITGATLLQQKYTANKGNNIFTLTNLSGLARGVYIVRVIQNGLTIGIGKVLKQ